MRIKDLDALRICLRAYARALDTEFNLAEVEAALRADDLGVFLIAKEQEIAPNMTIIDLVGNADRKFVLSIQLSAKPRRAKMAQGWPESPEQNLERLVSAGYVQDCGVPLCGNCGELGHIRKVSIQTRSYEHHANTFSSTVAKKSLNMSQYSLLSSVSIVRRSAIARVTAPRSALTRSPARTASRRATTPRNVPSLVQPRVLSAASATRRVTSPRM